MLHRQAVAACAVAIIGLLGGCTVDAAPVDPPLSTSPSMHPTPSRGRTAAVPCATPVPPDTILTREYLTATYGLNAVTPAVAHRLSPASCDDGPGAWPEASCDSPWDQLGDYWGRNTYGVDYYSWENLALADGFTNVIESFLHFRGPITLGRSYLLDQAEACHEAAGVDFDGARVFWSPELGGPPVTVIDQEMAFRLDGPSTVVTEELVSAALQQARAAELP